MELLCGGALLLAAGFAAGEARAVHIESISVSSWLALGYLVAFGSLVGFTSYIYLLGKVPTTAASTYAYVNPLVAVLLGWAVLGERITAQTLVAAGLIVAAVALILSRPPVSTGPSSVPVSEVT
jgi:drug/metabolite transporter (DMT)-like permease